jgi:hypothetical protein
MIHVNWVYEEWKSCKAEKCAWPLMIVTVCWTKYSLRASKLGRGSNDHTCSNAPMHYLHIHMILDKSTRLPETVIETRWYLCNYHTILSCQSPHFSKNIINTFVASPASTKLVIDALETLYKLLSNASRGDRRLVRFNKLEIINIIQAKHGIQVN